jgi:hypothetical protein
VYQANQFGNAPVGHGLAGAQLHLGGRVAGYAQGYP